jgi:hypothetical protein
VIVVGPSQVAPDPTWITASSSHTEYVCAAENDRPCITESTDAASPVIADGDTVSVIVVVSAFPAA